MNRNTVSRAAGKIRVILPVILRITLSLALWALGVTTTIAEASSDPLAFTKQQENNPQLTRRAALTTPSGASSRLEIR